MRRIGFVSLGCPKNLVDSEVMMGLLVREGFALTTRASEAEILVVNTCAFIDPAKRESLETILEMARWKKVGRCRKLIVTGCLAERYRDQLRRELPEIDVLLGTHELERIVEVCREDGGKPSCGRRRRMPILPVTAPIYVEDPRRPRLVATSRPTAYLKIAEGCDHVCSFCIIPKLRGPFRSRTKELLLREAEALVAQGVRELVLVAQDTTHYGEDLGMREGLAMLLRALARIEGVRWIRFLYAYPNHVSDLLIETVAEEEKICPYFDIPLQHVSARLLRAMRRGGTRRALERLLEKIRRRIPEAVVRTAFIVGFPGETERDFHELLDFCRAMEFDYVGAFIYSDEEGTAAFELAEKVPPEVARERRRRLLEEQERIVRRKMRRRIGQVVDVLVEGYARSPLSVAEEVERDEQLPLLRGRTAAQAPEIDGQVILDLSELLEREDFSEEMLPRPGDLVPVRLVNALGYDLIGRILPGWKV